MEKLFHAYVIGGAREDARAYIEKMTEGVSDRLETEQVVFTIDHARELKRWQELAGDTRVFIAYADFISREAENALLKTLEEPSEGVHIIFAVPKPEMLLPTLLSRVRVHIPAAREEKNDDAQHFLKLAPAERLAFVQKLVEKGDDEEAAAQVRERTLALVNDLEKHFSTDPQKNADALEKILGLKKYLYTSGASSRIILETLALTI